MKYLKDKKLFLLDMDGTLYLDDCLFPKVKEFLNCIKSKGGAYIFLTNNSSKGVESYVKKMESLGIPCGKKDFLTSVDALIFYLKKRFQGSAFTRKIYVLGTSSFKNQMKDEGFKVTDKIEADIETLIVGFDRELTFSKLEDACILLSKGVDFIATNPDWVCPTAYGYVPDCGSFCRMLTRATGKEPIFIGKPEPLMAELAIKKTGFDKDEALIVGDRLYTDIACGVNAGIDSVFVLSGEGRKEDIAEYGITPTYTMENVGELLRRITDEIRQ